MAKHYDKAIERAQANAAAVGQKPDNLERMTRDQVESFIRGFGIKGPSVRRISDAWMNDQSKAYDAGWQGHADAVYYDEY